MIYHRIFVQYYRSILYCLYLSYDIPIPSLSVPRGKNKIGYRFDGLYEHIHAVMQFLNKKPYCASLSRPAWGLLS